MDAPKRLAKETVREYAYRALKHNIVTLALEPGSMLSENKIAAELGISRTPVREALIELAKMQLVEVFPQKGSRIAKVNYALVEEARFMRLVMEKAIAEMMCDVATEEQLRGLDELLRLQEFYLERSSPLKLLELDNEFHRRMFEICRMNQIHYLMSGIMTHFDRVRSLSLQVIKEIKIVGDHRAILSAIRAKDKAAAARSVTEHLSRYRIDEDLIRAKYPQYFE